MIAKQVWCKNWWSVNYSHAMRMLSWLRGKSFLP